MVRIVVRPKDFGFEFIEGRGYNKRTRRGTVVMAEWYEHSFGEDYLLVYKHRDARGAKHEVHQMVSWLGLPQGAKVLDLCCGMGRHSMALYEAGYQVTGVDLSEVLLREAQRNDPDRRVTWMRSDMRQLPLEGGFDAVLNLFTSFGYFEHDEEHIQVLQEIYRMLKPGGRFLIDFLNPEYTKAHLVPSSERVDEEKRITEQRIIEDGYVKKHITISEISESRVATAGASVHISAWDSGDNSRQYLERIKLYSRDDFERMLNDAGLKLEVVYGGYDEEIYDVKTSPRMIMIGSRL